MTASAESVSATPILDTVVRPSRPGKTLGGTVPGLLAAIPFAAVLITSSNSDQAAGQNIAGYVLVIYFMAILWAIIAHEVGHLLAGWMVGFRFSSITIGPVSLKLEYGRLKIQLRRLMPVGGYAGMHIDHIRRVRRRLLVFSAGGPAANLITSVVVASLLAYVPMIPGWLAALGKMFWMISAIVGVLNLLPLRLGAIYADGARIRMLLSSFPKTRRWICLTAVGNQSQAGIRPKTWKRTWLDAAARIRDRSVDDFAGNWMAYVAANDRKEASVAAIHLERCLELANKLGPTLSDLVALEAAVFTAWFRQDAALSKRWLDQVQKLKTIPELLRIRAEIALPIARKEFSIALSRWQDAYAFIEKLPKTPIKQRLAEGFLEWRDEIRERERAYLASGDQAMATSS